MHPSVASLGDDPYSPIANHIFLAFGELLISRGAETGERAHRLVTGEQHPFGNMALLIDRAGIEETRRAIAPLLKVDAPSAVFFGGRVTDDVERAILDAGFARHSGMWAMGLDIEAMAETSLPEGFVIERVSDTALRDEWADVFSRGYELPLPVGAAFAGGINGDDRPDAPAQCFWIKQGETPVCTSLVYLADGMAGIYAVATVPEARKKGLGAHATAHPLRVAQQLGYKVGVLQASEAGRPVYQRLGFQDFGEMPLYIRMPG